VRGDGTDGEIDDELAARANADERARRLVTIPGIGPAIATAIVATARDVEGFASGREFSAFLGLTPRQRSSGGNRGNRGARLGLFLACS
jgi:transposase